MITESLLNNLVSPVSDAIYEMHKVAGQPFNKVFKDLKWITKYFKGQVVTDLKSIFEDVNKKDIIIFSPNQEKLEAMPKVKDKIIFPFENIFLEYKMMHSVHRLEFDDLVIKFTQGFFLKALKDNGGNITSILILALFLDYGANQKKMSEEGLVPKIIILPYDQLNNKPMIPEGTSEEDKNIIEIVISNLKKICYLVQSKEYSEYYKWTPLGVIKKEIVFAHDVKSHKRHFWEDSGKFKIPLMPKEELLNKGYSIDECVFRGYELRRDVPYKIIGSYKVGEKESSNELENRIINLLKKRTFKNEDKLGLILHEIFQSQIIRRHDRKIIKPLELDFYIHNLNLAFEYDGEQHFDRKICEEVFKSNFNEQRKRDIKKNALCRHKNINLIRIKYDEPLTVKNIKKIIKAKGVSIWN